MRITALILGIISGFWGMVIGFFGYGYTEFIDWLGEIPNIVTQVDNVQKTRLVSLLAPVFALIGGGIVLNLPYIAAVLLFLSGFGMYWGFQFGVFTMFPITLSIIAGALALIAGFLNKD